MRVSSEQKEQYNTLKEQAKEYKKSLYKDYPQVEKYENRKRTLITYLLILLIVIIAIHIYNAYSALGFHVLMIVSSLIRIDWIFILAALAPRWQLSLMLYLLFFNNASEFLTSLSSLGISSFTEFLQLQTAAFQQYPLAVFGDALTVIYLISILVVAIWLTLVPRNRELSGESEKLVGRVKEFIAKESVK